MSDYDKRNTLPQYVLEAIQDGYDIIHKALLVYCPIPPAAQIPSLRTAIVAVEAALSCIFSAMRNPDKDYGFGDLYSWPRSSYSFEYDGLCGHNALLDPVSGDVDYIPEQLEAIAADKQKKERLYFQEYGRKLRANPTEEYRAGQNRNNKIQKPATKARQQSAVANKQYYCSTCKVSCRDNASLVLHNATKRQQKKTVIGDDDFHCDFCDISFTYKSNFTRHLASKGHIQKSST